MPRDLFRSDADYSLGRARRWTAFPVVGLTYGVTIGALVVVPLVAMDITPRVRANFVFVPSAAVPIDVPPPPRSVSRTSGRAVASAVVGPPTVAPDMTETRDVFALSPFVASGVSGGLGFPETGSPGVTITAPPPFQTPSVPDRPVPIGGDIREPRKVVDVQPRYPAIARAARVEGVVILEATIARDGTVTNLRVLRSVPMLDAAAVEAVRDWRYTPTTLNGQAVEVVMTVTVRFSLTGL